MLAVSAYRVMGAYLNGFYAFAPVTDSDHSGLVWVAAILSLVFSFLTIITRYYIKKRNFGTDDYFILAAQVSLLLRLVSDTVIDRKRRLSQSVNISLYSLDSVGLTLARALF